MNGINGIDLPSLRSIVLGGCSLYGRMNEGSSLTMRSMSG